LGIIDTQAITTLYIRYVDLNPTSWRYSPSGSIRKTKTLPEQRRPSMTWARRLKRVFNIDISIREKRGGEAKIIACIEDLSVIDKMPSLGP
jgi:hypothetical protein